jgi:hypothetical protein
MPATGKRVPLSIDTAVSSIPLPEIAKAHLIFGQSKTHKKYLGEPDDPHYIPDSPWIERQFFSDEEEAELKCSCTLVLANVPHSDDMSDDPLKYIAAQIQEGKTTQQSKIKSESVSVPVQRVDASKTNSVTQHFLNLNSDTATPSESSNRDTLSTHDYATPLTSAGFTPGDSVRRFSDAARKSYNSTKKPGSSLRNESQLQTKSRTTSNSGLHRSFDTTNPSLETEAIKRTLRLVTDNYSRPQSGSSLRSMDNVNSLRFSSPDLNKSLPPPPGEPLDISDDPKQPHISRLMKTIRKKKSMTALDKGRSFSTSDAPPPLPTTTRSREAHSSKAEVPKTSYPQAREEEPSKKRFRLRLFTRRHHRPADVLVT